jgi:hypothetical protein
MKKLLKGLVIGALALNLVFAFGSGTITFADPSDPAVGTSVLDVT